MTERICIGLADLFERLGSWFAHRARIRRLRRLHAASFRR